MMGMDILRLHKARHVLEEMGLDASYSHKPDRRIPLVGDGIPIPKNIRIRPRDPPGLIAI